MGQVAVVTHLVSGDWRHVVEDGIVDADAKPDVVVPTGYAEFEPLDPPVAYDGLPSVAYTFAPVLAEIEGGMLAVRLVGEVGGQAITWRARVHLQYKGADLPLIVRDFELSADVRLSGGDLND